MGQTKALLLAGGMGTRLRPITDKLPKCLVTIAGKPILDYWIDALETAEIGEVLLNTHHLRDQVVDWINAINAERKVEIAEAFEPELLGSAGTITANQNWPDANDEIVVIYADNLSNIDLSDFLAFHRSHSNPISMALFQTPYPTKCGIATLDQKEVITAFVEKPERPESNLANAGIYILDSTAWQEIAEMRMFDFGFDVLPKFIGRMSGYQHSGYHRDIGTHESLAQAEADVGSILGK